MIDRAAEEAAIAAHIATKGVIRLADVDPVERAIEQWRREKSGTDEPGGGMRRMLNRRPKPKRAKPKVPATAPAKRSHKRKGVVPNSSGRNTKLRAAPNLHNATAPAVSMSAGADPQTIAELAYALWERDDRTHGRDVEHWLTAEAILRGKEDA